MNTEIIIVDAETEESSSASQILKTGVLIAGAALGAAAAANAFIAWNTAPLSGRLGGGFNRVPMRYGDLAYFVSGSGSPLLLLHALRPGNSSAEWQHNFDALAKKHTVYAPDFLGWGLSDKPRHILQPQDYVEQIQHFVQDVIGGPCAVVASGETCNLLLQAAQEEPQFFSSLVLICPLTDDADDEWDSCVDEQCEHEHNEPAPPLYRLLSLPIIGTSLLNILNSKANLSQAAQRLFFDPTRATPGVVARMHQEAHQPGAHQALAAQAAGLLEVPWREAWSTLEAPALLVWGRNAPDPGVATAPEWLAMKLNATLEVFDDAMLVPHIEHAPQFNERVLEYLNSATTS